MSERTLGSRAALVVARHALDLDSAPLPHEAVDVLVVGSGIAGLCVASTLGPERSVAVVTKGAPGDGATRHAQGGVAAALGAEDDPDLHFADTIAAGGGLCDEAAVRILVDEAASAIAFLAASGVRFDLDGAAMARTLEGGHSRSRIVHAGGDATGAELVRALLDGVSSSAARLVGGCQLVDLLTDADGAVCGALVVHAGRPLVVHARAVVLATGGYGRVYAQTTSPASSTGDGLAAALRAGAALRDVEFVQFHPTAMHVGTDPRPLVSEAVRGEGAVLRDASGALVTEGVHPLGDLAPRDIVSRAVVTRSAALGVDHLYLDATRVGRGRFSARFPTISAACAAAGIDPASQWIPVSPVAHYTMGGIATDLEGRSTLPGLYAVGETAATGVHGANRLASNSLLEGVVFGRRAGRAVTEDLAHAPRRVPLELRARPGRKRRGAVSIGERARAAILRGAGVVRDGEGLATLEAELARLGSEQDAPRDAHQLEDANVLVVGAALALAARRRKESRGAHFRSDFPFTVSGTPFRQHVTRADDGALEVVREPIASPQRTERAVLASSA